MAIVLDTNIVRGIGTGEVDVRGVAALRLAGSRIHLADGTMWELLHQLLTERFLWAEWLHARAVLQNLLDDDEPVLIGGSLGLHRAGLHDLQPYSASAISRNIAMCRAGWRMLIGAESAPELAEASLRIPSHAIEVSFSLEHARRIHAERAERWNTGFDDFRTRFVARSPELLDDLPQRDLRGPLAVYAEVVGAKRDRWRSDSGPKPSVRLDASIRVEGLLRLRYLRMRETYNPLKNANDSFDCELLQYLAYPAAVCTCDRGLLAKVADSGSWQQGWVFHPDALEDRAAVNEILALRWPMDLPGIPGAA